MISGFAEAAQETSPEEMMRLMHELGDVILHDPDVAGFGSQTGSHRQRADRQYRPLFHRAQAARRAQAHRLADHRPACGRSSPRSRAPTCSCSRRRTSPSARRIARGSFQYTLQDTNIAELNEWSQKLLEKMRTLPQLADVTSDLLANAPQLQITINRDQAVALRHFAAGDRRHAQRRLRPAPDHAVFHPAQDLFRGPGNPARAAEGPRPRSTASM